MAIPTNAGYAREPPPRTEVNGTAIIQGELPHRCRIAVLLIDPTRLTRECLAHFLRQRAADLDVQVAEEIAQATREQIPRPDIAIVNIKALAADDDAIRQTMADLDAAFGGSVPTLLVSERDDDPWEELRVIQLGMRGYFPASLGLGLLIAAIRLIMCGGVFLSPATVALHAARVVENGQRSKRAEGD